MTNRLSEKELGILNQVFQEIGNEDESDYAFSIQSILNSPELLASQKEEEDLEENKKLTEAKEKLSQAILVASGTKKIIEQLYSEGADVSLGDNEKEVKRAMKRTLKINSNKITFDVYKEAINRLRLISKKIKDAAVDEQLI